jgi:hypothetical protein
MLSLPDHWRVGPHPGAALRSNSRLLSGEERRAEGLLEPACHRRAASYRTTRSHRQCRPGRPRPHTVVKISPACSGPSIEARHDGDRHSRRSPPRAVGRVVEAPPLGDEDVPEDGGHLRHRGRRLRPLPRRERDAARPSEHPLGARRGVHRVPQRPRVSLSPRPQVLTEGGTSTARVCRCASLDPRSCVSQRL